MIAIKITFPSQYQQPLLNDGSQNPMFFEILQAVARSGGDPRMHVKDNKDGTCSQCIFDIEYLPLQKIWYILSLGGELEGYPAFLKIDSDPETTDSIYTQINDDGEEYFLTWKQWTGSSNTWRKINNSWYVGTNPNGKALKATELYNLLQNGYELLSQTDYKQLIDSILNEDVGV